jgi:hypothetical protein
MKFNGNTVRVVQKLKKGIVKERKIFSGLFRTLKIALNLYELDVSITHLLLLDWILKRPLSH